MIHPRLPRSWSLRSRLVAMSVVLTAIALVITDLSATFALRSYLIGKVDDQLTQVASGPVLRLNDMGLNDQMNDGDMMGRGRRVPSAFSVTLLDPSGNPLRTIGGGINEKPPSFAGITVQEALKHGAKPWTWHVEGCSTNQNVATDHNHKMEAAPMLEPSKSAPAPPSQKPLVKPTLHQIMN